MLHYHGQKFPETARGQLQLPHKCHMQCVNHLQDDKGGIVDAKWLQGAEDLCEIYLL